MYHNQHLLGSFSPFFDRQPASPIFAARFQDNRRVFDTSQCWFDIQKEMNSPCRIDATISITPLGKTNLFNQSAFRTHED